MASITKANLASRIHKALGVNTRFTEATPNQVIDTLETVNDWMLTNNGIGRRVGWVSDSANTQPDPNEETGLPDWAVQGVVYSCAQLVASYFDKPQNPAIMSAAAQGMQTILARTVERQEVNYPNRMPLGQGNRTPYGGKFYTNEDRITTENDFLKDEGGDVITSGDA